MQNRITPPRLETPPLVTMRLQEQRHLAEISAGLVAGQEVHLVVGPSGLQGDPVRLAALRVERCSTRTGPKGSVTLVTLKRGRFRAGELVVTPGVGVLYHAKDGRFLDVLRVEVMPSAA
jgi:hypothetical protein